MIVSKKGVDLIKSFEGLRLNAYKDSAGIWTIGYGTIQYEDGTPVKKGDVINEDQAEHLLQFEIFKKTKKLNQFLPVLNQNQFDACTSLAYNIGVNGFEGSTACKKIKSNPCDETIKQSWILWNKARVDGVLTEIKGLTKRRQKEVELYFSHEA